MTIVASAAASDAEPSRYAWSVLAMLAFVYLLDFLDRQLVSILAKPIQDELHLTDGELGRVGGIYFALFYAGISVPVAWAADRGNRVRILSLACLVWSAATMACGIATPYAWVPGVAILACLPFFAGFLNAERWPVALAFLAGPLFLSVFYLVPAAALVQNSVPPGERTMASALLLLMLNLVGLGLGPTYLGAMSDHYHAAGSAHALADAYRTLIPFFVVAGALQWLSARAIQREAAASN